MKFIVDAHLPLSLAIWLKEKGFDTIHTRDLPEQNFTEENNRVVEMNNNTIIVHY